MKKQIAMYVNTATSAEYQQTHTAAIICAHRVDEGMPHSHTLPQTLSHTLALTRTHASAHLNKHRFHLVSIPPASDAALTQR